MTDADKIYGSKAEACVALVTHLETSRQRWQHGLAPVQIRSSWSCRNQVEHGQIRLLDGPEVFDFFYEEKL